MIELIAVIIIASILGGFFIQPLVTSPKTTNLYAERDRLLSDIRYAQSLAMFSNQRYRLDFSQSNQYRILDSSGNAINYLAAGGQNIALQSGTTLSTNTAGKYLVFSGLGVPAISSSATADGSNTNSSTNVSLSHGGTTLSVSVLAQTGYASAS